MGTPPRRASAGNPNHRLVAPHGLHVSSSTATSRSLWKLLKSWHTTVRSPAFRRKTHEKYVLRQRFPPKGGTTNDFLAVSLWECREGRAGRAIAVVFAQHRTKTNTRLPSPAARLSQTGPKGEYIRLIQSSFDPCGTTDLGDKMPEMPVTARGGPRGMPK